jgi:hypothetical protein
MPKKRGGDRAAAERHLFRLGAAHGSLRLRSVALRVAKIIQKILSQPSSFCVMECDRGNEEQPQDEWVGIR